MMELAKRIYRMSPDQTQEFRNIIFDNTPEGIRTVVDPGLVFVFFCICEHFLICTIIDGSVGIDLYSLGKPLLERLWDFVADMASDDNESFTSQDHHESDLEFDSDVELGEYKSDDNNLKFTNNNYSDIDEPGFHQSDIESDNYTDQNTKQTNGYHHTTTENGYHDTSDMDIQDDDDY